MAAPPSAPPCCAPCLAACALSAWYPALRRSTFRTAFVPLSDPQFLAYLDADGIVLPAVAEPANLAPHDPRAQRGAAAASAPAGGASAPAFPALERAITAAIDAVGGAAMPKLDWTAPADATWLALNGNTQCTSAGEVFLLLKGSDLARYDLDLAARLAAQGCTRPTPAAAGGAAAAPAAQQPPLPPSQHPPFRPCLALRAWYTLHPAGEFRCFVRHRRLVGVCQRHTGQRFEHLLPGDEAARAALGCFFADRVLGAFPLRDYVFDAYLDRRGRWWLVDFAPFGYDTDALLFSWDELAGGGGQAAATLACCEHAQPPAPAGDECSGGCGEPADAAPAFRVVADAPPMGFPPLAQHRFPDDLLELSAMLQRQQLGGAGAAVAGGEEGAAGGGGGGGGPHLDEDLLERMRARGLFQSGTDSDDSVGDGGGDDGRAS